MSEMIEFTQLTGERIKIHRNNIPAWGEVKNCKCKNEHGQVMDVPDHTIIFALNKELRVKGTYDEINQLIEDFDERSNLGL